MPKSPMEFILGKIIKSVRRSAVKAGGQCTWEFSQMEGIVAKTIGSHNITKEGICEMLSAKWIECHAKGDHMANWMKSGSVAIDPSKIRSLMQLFIIGETMNPGAMHGNVQMDAIPQRDAQTKCTKRWLEKKGLLCRQHMALVERGGGGHKDFGSQLATDIAQAFQNSSGSYRTIGIWGEGGGHAMAAWGAQDVAFFDPNFGEFWFESAGTFITWFREFWKKSHYNSKHVGLSDSYELMDYAMKA